MNCKFLVSGVLTTVALGLLTACNASSEKDSEPAREVGETTLMLRGTNTETMSSVPIALRDVSIIADGKALAVNMRAGTLDLAGGKEYRAARFAVPPGAKMVQITVLFDDYGGYEARDGTAGVLDARGTSLRLEVPASALLESGAAQVSLDLGRSLLETRPETRLLAPHYAVSY